MKLKNILENAKKKDIYFAQSINNFKLFFKKIRKDLTFFLENLMINIKANR